MPKKVVKKECCGNCNSWYVNETFQKNMGQCARTFRLTEKNACCLDYQKKNKNVSKKKEIDPEVDKIKEVISKLNLNVEIESACYGMPGTITIALRLGEEVLDQEYLSGSDIKRIMET